MLGAASPDVRLGDVTLHPHQKQALSRIQELLARDRVAGLGDAAARRTDEELARHVVRRSSGEIAHFPALDGPHWIRPPMDDDVLDALRAMPSPLPASDEGSAGELVVYSLLRQWASSRAALVAALRRRIARATAMRASL